MSSHAIARLSREVEEIKNILNKKEAVAKPTRILAVDPGPTHTGWVEYELKTSKILNFGLDHNDVFEDIAFKYSLDKEVHLVIEKPALIGQMIWYQIFDTCIWIGEVKRIMGKNRTHYITRATVKKHLLGKTNAKGADSLIRKKLIDRIGIQGTKKNPGPLFGIKGDIWAALAIAVTWKDLMDSGEGQYGNS